MDDKYIRQAAVIKGAGFEVLVDRSPLTLKELAELMQILDGAESLEKAEAHYDGIWTMRNEDD